tara:strand:- start:8608 stop:9378 length:771 start_codon:yes stop_codon:yes gene_type:complete
MLKKDKKLKKVVNSTVSGAALEMIDELEKNDVSLDEFSGGDFFERPDNRGEERLPLTNTKNTQNMSDNLEFITSHLSEKQDVPGASLTNDPEKPYPWEQPPQFANPREAQDYMYTLLSTPEVAADIVTALGQGISVMDLTSLFVFTGFVSGKFTPDVGLLIGEPTAYFIMGIGEMANIEYKIEDDDTDLDEFIEGNITEEIMKLNNMERIKQLSNKNKVQKKDLPKEVLAEVEQRVDTSLLAPTETEDNNLLDRTE